MTTFARSIEIDAPQAWLFELMQDYDRRLAWDEFLSKAELVGGASASALGVRAWCVDTSGRGMETEYVSFKPPERVAVKMTRGPWMFHSFAGSWAYRAVDDERTEVTFRYNMELRPRFLGKLGDRLLAKIFSRDMERRLASAKSRLERLYREREEAAPPRDRPPIEMGRLEVLQGDITELAVDAIVNAANERMLGGSGVDGAIHRAAGPALLEACRAVPAGAAGVRCPTGEARLTPGFELPARFVIHTVGPVYEGGDRGEGALLAAAYRNSLELAAQHGLKTIAFPAISTGVYGYPLDEAATIAVRECRDFLAREPAFEKITLVAFHARDAEVLRAAVDAS